MLTKNKKVNISIITMALVCSSAFFALNDYATGLPLSLSSFIIGMIYMMGVYEANLEYLKRGNIK